MKTIAQIDNENKVINIILVDDNFQTNDTYVEYNENNPAHINGDYFEGLFYAPKPFASWTRFEGQWIAPKPHPGKGEFYWDEQLGDWVEALAE
jgi:hypothetical protein